MNSTRRSLTLLALCALVALTASSFLSGSSSLSASSSSSSAPSLSFFVSAHEFDDDEDEPVKEPPPASKPKPASSAGSSVHDFDEDEVAELLADEDEFEGGSAPAAAATAKNTKGKQQKQKKKQKKQQKTGAAADADPDSVGNVINNGAAGFFQPIGLPEYIGISFLVLYIINYFIGSGSNATIAKQWTQHFRAVIEEQFAYIGADTAAGAVDLDASSFTLLKDSESCYKLYASGRRFCSGMLITLDLAKRQDLFSTIIGLIDSSSNKDSMIIEIPVDEEIAEPFVFALSKMKTYKKFMKSEADLENMTVLSKSALASKSGFEKYAILNEMAELEPEVLNDKSVRILTANKHVEKLLQFVHYSDQLSLPFAVSKKVLRVKFNLPSNWKDDSEDSELGSALLLTKWAFYLLDRIGGEIRLNSSQKARSEAKRKKILEAAAKATAKDRAELAAKKKEEQRKKEAEIIAANPNSELAKELIKKKELREAKQLKKRQGAHIKVMR